MIDNEAVATLKAFFKEMSKWEIELHKLMTSDWEHIPESEIDAEVESRKTRSRHELRRIFLEFVVEGDQGRRVIEPLYYGGAEPDYNPETEEILSVTNDGQNIVIETQMTHNLRFRFRYTLVLQNGKWLILDNRKGMGVAKRWKPVDL